MNPHGCEIQSKKRLRIPQGRCGERRNPIETSFMAEVFGCDCYAPRQIAERAENVGVSKANLPLFAQVALGIFLRERAAVFAGINSDVLNWVGLARNLLGRAGMVGLVYWVIYRRGAFAISTEMHSQ